ncbi:hypothetical protein [Sulfurospirillum cavolei]|uniref:hypothetical protein n=1 Tax=Sulfurospirillum cavolei TaxID=366522 RepID=UPI000764A7AD|nr:hypothetical protein [Sulfurospirillum cavolei]
MIVGAGAAAIIAGLYGEDIYNMYTKAQNSFFKWLTDSNVSFDTSLDRFLFLEGADINEEELNNLINAYNKDNPDGHQTDYNPFTPRMQDPLVIDADKDGLISTVSLAESEVYFDITGNGVKTKTSWVKGNDAILVYDENEDGKIDNINEAFGNATTSGFDELRNTIDSNYDNKIDRKDILFNRLQLWHDYDQDGAVDKGELKTLKEEGITSIDLNSVQTNIIMRRSKRLNSLS